MTSSALLEAHAYLTGEGLSVTRFTGLPRTPGNVGIALSGGGSRSASSCMGGMRALHALGLLDHVRAISSVSGGSWFSVPFTFLPKSFDDETFLGTYVADPATLRWSEGDDPTDLRTLPEDNFGVPLTKWTMSLASVLVRVMRERLSRVPENRLWTRMIGDNLLAHFDLARFDDDELPADYFALDQAMADAIALANPGLPERCYVVRQGGAVRRPFLIVNGAMRVRGRGDVEVLAPVQFTPVFAGIMGSKIGALMGQEVGGGGISSFAFGGQWLVGSPERPKIEQQAPLALSDIAGISSAAYADLLSDHGFLGLDPSLIYFSTSWPKPAGTAGEFEDAGSLENTAIANLLAYSDIDNVIAFVNPPDPIVQEDGDIVVDSQIPPLFGMRPWEKGQGYRPYRDPGEGNPDFASNQVFSNDKGEFQALLEGFGKRLAEGGPMAVEQELEVVRNDKFAVAGGKRVRVLWIVLSPCKAWEGLLDAKVRSELPRRFPNFMTAETELSVADVSLVAHFTGWVVGECKGVLERMFR